MCRIDTAAADHWIGLKYEDLGAGIGRHVVWRDGTKPGYTKIYPGLRAGLDHLQTSPCIYVLKSSPYDWYNIDCTSTQLPYICEKPKGTKFVL